MNYIRDIALFVCIACAIDIEDRKKWHDDEINVTVERGGEKKQMHFKQRDWEDMHGDELFNLSWLGSIADDSYWEDRDEDNWTDAADLDDPSAFNN